MTHSPGPWTLFELLERHGHKGYRISAETTLLVDLWPCADGYRYGENEANARLIAAAPDLLEACELAVAEFTVLGQALGELTSPEMVDAWNKIEAAIFKAKGQDPMTNHERMAELRHQRDT